MDNGTTMMMERNDQRMDVWYPMIGGILLLAGAAILMIRANESEKKRFLEKIRRNWGAAPDDAGKRQIPSMAAVYKKEEETAGYFVDDITWNDLDMDRIYERLNSTVSSCGEVYLYQVLRFPERDPAVLAERERLIEYFDSHEKEREAVQEILGAIGTVKGITAVDPVKKIRMVPKKSMIRYRILAAFSVCSIFMLLLVPALGVLLFLASVSVNAWIHSKEAGRIEEQLKALSYILRILRSADRLARLNMPELSEYQEHLINAEKELKSMRRKCRTLVNTKGQEKDFFHMIYVYLHTFFMLDLLEFYSVAEEIGKTEADIRQLTDILGGFDFAIAAASFRRSVPYYCIPEFVPAGSAEDCVMLEAEDLYHPLLVHPVANSVCTKKGILITGSNASGKSTFLKAVALNAVLAESVHTALAHSWKGDWYRVYSSMSQSDNLVNGDSYYMAEVKSVKRILDAGAGQIPLLCVIDEVLHGTNTIERIAASSQILRALQKPHMLCFAATHDVELTYILETLYANYHFDDEITEDDIRFSYQLKKGRTRSRNAIALLSQMGYSKELVEEAREQALKFEEYGTWEVFT